jgi:glycosyltransferase involved in cell wall biosynthesis
MRNKNLKILYFIQMPPPVHGVSVINSIIYNSRHINDGIDKTLLEIKFSDSLSRLRRLNTANIARFFSLLRDLRGTLAREKPDCVYFSLMPVGKGLWRDVQFVRIIKRYGPKLIYHLHNSGLGGRTGNRFWRILYRYILSDSFIIHLSDGLVNRELKPLNIPRTVQIAVPNGIPGVILGPVRQTRACGQDLTILFLSNLFPGKGIYNAVRIMSMVKERRQDIKLRIAGDFLRDKYRTRLMKMISDMGMHDTVSVVGSKFGHDKEEELIGADVFLFPSSFSQESFPLVILEAMSCGLPVISSSIGAVPEIIDHDKDGLLVDPGDLEGFARAVLDLASSGERRRKIGLAARKKYENKYTAAHLEQNIRKVIEGVLSIKE